METLRASHSRVFQTTLHFRSFSAPEIIVWPCWHWWETARLCSLFGFEFVPLGLWESPLRAELDLQMAARSFLRGNQEKKDWIVEASVASGSSIP